MFNSWNKFRRENIILDYFLIEKSIVQNSKIERQDFLYKCLVKNFMKPIVFTSISNCKCV